MANLLVSSKNRHYEIVDRLGEGGFGAVFKVKCQEDSKIYAFKYFAPTEDPEMKKAQANIRRNVESLVKSPLTYGDGTLVESLVRPLEMVTQIPGKSGFGYIMEFKNISQCGTIFKSWRKYELYKPDAKQICEFCIKIAKVFDRIHASGRVYKDVNEGNIYFDLANDKIYVMDCDNIAADNVDTILGTVYYLAPEVYATQTPNAVSDRYSMAVYFYRLMVGGYPLEGKKSVRHIIDKGLDDLKFQDAKQVYSESVAVFAFDEKNKTNSIENVTDSKIPDSMKNQWKIQASFWKMLPDPIRAMFQKVFSENLTGNAKDRRPTERQWVRMFEDVIDNHIVKCKCGKHNFACNDKCLFCGKKLPALPPKPQPKPQPAPQPKIVPQKPVPQNSVKYKILTGKNAGKEVFIDKVLGSDVLPSVYSGSQTVLETVLYSQNKKMMKIRNTSGNSILVTYPDGEKVTVVNNGSAFITPIAEIEFLVNGKSAAKLKVETFKL